MAVADVLHLANCSITEISGGERQRAFIAMCLAQEPQVLLLDEPVSHLDIGHQLATLEMIRTLNRQDNVTVLAVFHDLNLAAEFCDRLAILNRGELEAIGPAVEVITSEMIRDVYGAQVYTEQNPVSHKPHIVVAAGMNGQRANVDHWAVSGPCPLPSVSRSGGGGEHGQP
jgi:iron complex transport system ATP-binding protein